MSYDIDRARIERELAEVKVRVARLERLLQQADRPRRNRLVLLQAGSAVSPPGSHEAAPAK